MTVPSPRRALSPPGAPLPPADIDKRDLLFHDLAAGTILHRFYTAGPATNRYEPVFFDKGELGRFNAPDGSYGVLYAARSRSGAFAETFLRNPGGTLIPGDIIDKKAYVELRTTVGLRFIRFHGPGLFRLGATAEVTHCGLPYTAPQQWSACLHAIKGERFDGIAYRARHDDDEFCYAIFDHFPLKIVEKSRKINLDQNWFYKLFDRYGAGRAPSP